MACSKLLLTTFGQAVNWDYSSWSTENCTRALVTATSSHTSPAFAYVGILMHRLIPRLWDWMVKVQSCLLLLPHSLSHLPCTTPSHRLLRYLCPVSIWFPAWFQRCALPTLNKDELTCILSSSLPGNCFKMQQRCNLWDVILQVKQMLSRGQRSVQWNRNVQYQ